jgi:hypothetical protein
MSFLVTFSLFADLFNLSFVHLLNEDLSNAYMVTGFEDTGGSKNFHMFFKNTRIDKAGAKMP